MEAFTYELMYKVEDTHWWYRTRRAILDDLLQKYAKPGASILEVGCGTGSTLEGLQKKGYSTLGIDMSIEAKHFAAKRGVSVEIGDAEKLPVPSSSVDAVLLLDVIEHIDHDTDALREASRVLRPGGVVIVFTPAFMWMWGRQDRISHHKRRYTKRTLLAHMPTTLRAVRISYFNTFLFLPVALVRLTIEKMRMQHLPEENAMTSGFVNSILSFIFGVERYLLRYISFPFGVSIMMVAKKQ